MSAKEEQLSREDSARGLAAEEAVRVGLAEEEEEEEGETALPEAVDGAAA
jgi:hypothetical protein